VKSSVYQGIWEEISLRHAGAFQGHRVEIRILDNEGASTPEEKRIGWTEFEEKVRQVTTGVRLPSSRILVAEDFYESLD